MMKTVSTRICPNFTSISPLMWVAHHCELKAKPDFDFMMSIALIIDYLVFRPIPRKVFAKNSAMNWTKE
jgi:hypothetical protein